MGFPTPRRYLCTDDEILHFASRYSPISRTQIDILLQMRSGGSVMLTDEGRKILLAAYQKRKQTEVNHSLLKTKTPLGLVPHLQARILARHLRGDMREYYPYYLR